MENPVPNVLLFLFSEMLASIYSFLRIPTPFVLQLLRLRLLSAPPSSRLVVRLVVTGIVLCVPPGDVPRRHAPCSQSQPSKQRTATAGRSAAAWRIVSSDRGTCSGAGAD